MVLQLKLLYTIVCTTTLSIGKLFKIQVLAECVNNHLSWKDLSLKTTQITKSCQNNYSKNPYYIQNNGSTVNPPSWISEMKWTQNRPK